MGHLDIAQTLDDLYQLVGQRHRRRQPDVVVLVQCKLGIVGAIRLRLEEGVLVWAGTRIDSSPAELFPLRISMSVFALHAHRNCGLAQILISE